MIQVTVETRLTEEWAKIQGVLAQGIKRAVENAVREGAEEARRVHPYVDRTGHLTQSIHGRLERFDHLGAEGVLEATAPYASFVENGTRPHTIVPKQANVLRWEDEGSGEAHYAKSVQHPGTKPHPFMGPALLKAERVLERDIHVAVAKAQEELR